MRIEKVSFFSGDRYKSKGRKARNKPKSLSEHRRPMLSQARAYNDVIRR
jgi:hypothetical protein